jgi:hypothetical protein
MRSDESEGLREYARGLDGRDSRTVSRQAIKLGGGQADRMVEYWRLFVDDSDNQLAIPFSERAKLLLPRAHAPTA